MMSRNEVCRMYESAVRTYERVMTFTNSRHWMHSLCHLRKRNSEREREWESERAREREGARGSECEIQREREREREGESESENVRAGARASERETGREWVCVYVCARKKERRLGQYFQTCSLHTGIHARMHPYAGTHVRSKHAHTHTHKKEDKHTYTHTYTYTYKHTHTCGRDSWGRVLIREDILDELKTAFKMYVCIYLYRYT